MVELLGIELSEHTVFIILSTLAVLSVITSIVSYIAMIVSERNCRYDMAYTSCITLIMSLVVFVVVSLFAPIFRQ
jgi:hypothetical protein